MNTEAMILHSGELAPAGGNLGAFVDRVLMGLQSPQTRRAYHRAITAFVAFLSARREPLSKSLMNEWRESMRVSGSGDAAINSALVAVRFFLREAAADGLIDAAEAERACKVRGIAQRGVRAGNWATKAQAEALIQAPDTSTLLGTRDRAILACLLGAGLRRSECAALTVEHFQQRDARWAIVDIVGKRNKVRTIPIPSWCKVLVDAWLNAAGITSGPVFRQCSWAEDKFHVGQVALSDRGIARAVARYAGQVGAAGLAAHDCRRTFAKLAHKGGADLAQIQICLGHDSLETTQKYLGAELNYSNSAADYLGLDVV